MISIVKINIFQDSCSDPNNCRKCIQACPVNIFVLKPIGTKKMCTDVKKWEIRTVYKDFCNGCMKCVEICPEGCIEVEF